MKRIVIYSILILSSIACEHKFLDEKPSSNIIRPQTLDDLESLLDNDWVINVTGVLKRVSSDEYYILNEQTWKSLPWATQRNAYIWQEDLYQGETGIKDWDYLYRVVFYANSVLGELEEINVDDIQRSKDLKGKALFIRAFANYDLVNTFANFYNPETADLDLGIPIRLSADINKVEQRSSVKACYQHIITDLEESLSLIVSGPPDPLRTRPSKAAAYALLAKVYLNMANYQNALEATNKTLELYSYVTDFNTLDLSSEQPFRNNYNDIIYYTTQVQDFTITSGVGPLTANYISIDTLLLSSYDASIDLRFPVFFSVADNGNYYRKMMFGSRLVNLYPFTGLATDEIFLIKAECETRLGKDDQAKKTLLSFLEKRFIKGYRPNLNNLNNKELLERVFEERKKELIWRSTRWSDIKRLSRDGEELVLTRIIGENHYELKSNSPRFIFPIPDNELIHLKK